MSSADQPHDGQCERMPNFYLCHCAKRERLAKGKTELPTLAIQYPICTGCREEVSHDGDTYVCYECHASWGENAGDGDTADHFMDDYDWTDRDGVVHTLDDDVKAWRERHLNSQEARS